ncbi:MAG TPA: 30S ribosomal protein S13 [Candidatus Saccharimonadales bacterium]|nr:30S ribosomal protein S13 [Candidatus Saccharimonadales bacterium]
MAQEKQEKGKHEGATSIIRIAGRDINGSFRLVRALMQIKGIGYSMARAIAMSYEKEYKISQETYLKDLSDPQVAQLEAMIKEPQKLKNIPRFMLNRRKDFETGEDMHVVGVDLSVKVRQDVDQMIKIQSWVGHRHQYGQKVRGQRTRSTGRTGATIGVMKKAAEAQMKAAQKSGTAEDKK